MGYSKHINCHVITPIMVTCQGRSQGESRGSADSPGVNKFDPPEYKFDPSNEKFDPIEV